MFRDHYSDEMNISRIGILFCCILSFGIFLLALRALPLKSAIPAQLERFTNIGSSGRKASNADIVIKTPVASAAASSAAAASASPSPVSAEPLAPAPIVEASAAASPAPPRPSASASAAPKASVPPRASAQPSASAKPEPAGGSYTVQAGDTLYSIAKRYGVTTQALAATNGLSDAGALKVGQRLEIK